MEFNFKKDMESKGSDNESFFYFGNKNEVEDEKINEMISEVYERVKESKKTETYAIGNTIVIGHFIKYNEMEIMFDVELLGKSENIIGAIEIIVSKNYASYIIDEIQEENN